MLTDNTNMPLILIVEDDGNHAELMKLSLQDAEEEYRLEIAGSLQDARTVIERQLPNLVLTEYKLPDGVGSELVTVVKKLCPVVLMTSQDNARMAVDAMKAGALDYVVKSSVIFSGMSRIVKRGLREWLLIQEKKRAEDALRDSEEKHRVLFDNAGDAIFIHDEEARMLAVNPMACERLGYTQTELMSMTINLVDSPEHGEYAPDRIARLMEQGHIVFETVHQRKDGSPVPTEVSARKIIWNGQAAMLAICRDITERNLAEKTLLEINHQLEDANLELLAINSELEQRRYETEEAQIKLQQLSSAVLNSPVTVVITDYLGRIEYVNPKFTETSGYLPEEAIGQNPRILKAGAQSKEFYRELWETICAGKEWRGDFCNRKKNGDTYWEHATISPIRDEQGSITHFVAIKEDITEDRRIADELRKSEEKHRILFDYAGDAILILDKDAHILAANPLACERLGYTQAELISMTINQVNSPEQNHYVPDRMAQLMGQGLLIFETVHRCKNGSPIPTEVNARKISWEGQPAIMSICRDITERKRVEEKLLRAKAAAESANIAKSSFLANMSHEIRTPLNAIIGFSALSLKTQLPPRQHDYMEKIHTAGELLLNIINDILDFSKVEAGQLTMEQIPFSVDIIIANVTGMIEQKALDKGLNLLVETSPQVVSCLTGDPHRLVQIITNLLNNAVKFTEHGKVVLETELLARDKDRVQLKFTIRDTGIGIADEQSCKLFQPFTQADESTTRRFGGTGLGLSISKQLVELMGGEIWCESRPGLGSTFCFTAWFGICHESNMEECAHVCSMNTAHKESHFDLSGSRILLVEDNEINRQLAIELLKETGAEIYLAVNGEEAVAMITDDNRTYDLVLMDIQMPLMDGFEATRLIRSDSRFRHLPIIAMTAHAMQEERQKIAQAGMDAHITKPIDARTMLKVIGSFLREQESSVHFSDIMKDNTSDEPNFIDIAGIDVSGALYRLDGDSNLFLWVLRAFIKNGSNAASAIEEALRVGDMKLAERHAHTIKSTAGSMGAVELAKLAQSLEQAIDQGKPHEIIRSTLKDFAAESERLVTELKSRLTTESQTGEEATLPSEVNVAVVTPIMNRLLDYIRGSDCRAELYLDDYQRELEGVPDKDIAKLKAQLKNFDFDAAHEALLNLTSRNGIMLSHDDSEEYRS